MLENLFYDVAHDLDLLGEDPETIPTETIPLKIESVKQSLKLKFNGAEFAIASYCKGAGEESK